MPVIADPQTLPIILANTEPLVFNPQFELLTIPELVRAAQQASRLCF